MRACDRFNVIESPDGSIKIARVNCRSNNTGTVLYTLDAIVWDGFVSWHYKNYGGSFLNIGKELLTERIENYLSIL